MPILWFALGFICFPILFFVIGSLLTVSAFMRPENRLTSGETPNGRFIAEGQRWNLKKDINKGLRAGVHIIKTYYADSILLIREDDQHFLNQGESPVYYFDIMDNENFELMEKK